MNRPRRPDGRMHERAAGGARRAALRVLSRVSDEDAYANLALPAEVERLGLDARDAGLATELGYGSLRRLGTLDWVLSFFCDRPVERLDPEVRDALRLGCYQLLYTEVPSYAAVSETVGLVERRAAGFVNAVLRRIAADPGRIPWPTRDGDLASFLEIHHSHPRWIVDKWLSELGPRHAEALMEANNSYPGIGIRVRAGQEPAELRRRLTGSGLDVSGGAWTAAALTVRSGGSPQTWPGFEERAFAVQDEGSVLTGEVVAGERPDVAFDLCAGPGGKTVQIAESARTVLALEIHAHRARLVANAAQMLEPSGRVHVVRADGARPPLRGRADAVLVDAPCSGLGVLRRRPESRWRIGPADVDRLAHLQSRLLDAAAGLVRDGGTLVYAVCTVTRAETIDVVERLLRSPLRLESVHPRIPRLGAETPDLQLLPHVHGTDGMYIAKLRKVPA